MSSEEDSIVLDSDEDSADVETPRVIKKKNRNIIVETDDEDEVVFSDEEFIDDGRMTPSIHKAIRRSIFNISQDEVIEDSDCSDSNDTNNVETFHDTNDSLQNETASSISEDGTNHNAFNSSNIDNSNKSSICEVNLPDSNDNTEKLPQKLSSENIEAVRQSVFKRYQNGISSLDSDSDDEVQITSAPKSRNLSTQIIAIDTDSEKSGQSYDDISATSEFGQDSSTQNCIAEKRAKLMNAIQSIEREMKHTKIFLKEGNLNILPDKGKKLHMNLAKHNEKLLELHDELQKLPPIDTTQLNRQSESTAMRIRNNFFDGRFDPKDLLKPTASTSTGNFGKKALETFQREQALTVDRLGDLHVSILSRPTDDTRAPDPHGLRIKLMGHQQHALAWLMWREKQKPAGGVLADDMGLGKTLTMISLIMASLAENNGDDDDDDDDEWIEKGRALKHQGGTLVVCPASLVSQWENEIKNRCKRGLLSVELYHGNNRETQPKRLARNNVVITTYNLLSREYKNRGVIYNVEWKRVILDEAHVIRNHKSQTCESVCGILARKRWALTGTPIHNKEMDLYAILKFLKCSPFDDLRVWKKWVDNKNAAGHERLATVMKSLMLRRTKQELINNGSLDALPEKALEIIKVELDREERLIHDKVMVYSKTLFAQFLSQRAEKLHNFELGAGKFDGFINNCVAKNTQFNKAQKKLLAHHADVKQHEILVLLLRLRQLCCHPSLLHSMLDKDDYEVNGLDDDSPNDLMTSMMKLNLDSGNTADIDEDEGEGDVGVDKRVSEHLLTSDNPVFDRSRKSTKLRAVLQLVEEILEKNEKMIIVSQWTSYLEIVAEQLKYIKGASYKIFSGAVAVKNRQDIIDSFNKKNDDPKILLLSLTAGGVGLNLVGANHLFLIDIHWNPQLESQAQDRIYRFGQTNNVFIYKFICTDTIEERIKNLQDKKLEIASAVLTGTRNNAGSKLTLNDLKSLFNI